MTALQSLNALRAGGVDLSLVGETLRASSREALIEPARTLIRTHKPELMTLLRAGETFVQSHAAALAAVGWQVNPSDPGLLGALQGGGQLEGVQPWRIVFRAVDGSRRALLRSGRWLDEEGLNEMEQEEFFTQAGRHIADGYSLEEADKITAELVHGELKILLGMRGREGVGLIGPGLPGTRQ